MQPYLKAGVCAALSLLWAARSLSADAREMPRYARCIDHVNPPHCLIEQAMIVQRRLPPDAQDSGELLEAVIYTGAVDLVMRYERALVAGARSQSVGAEEFMEALGIEVPSEQLSAEVKDAQPKLLIAAVALAAAARAGDDPYNDPLVRRLMKAAQADSAVSYMAVRFWHEMEMGGQTTFPAPLTMPPGLIKIWQALVSSPPQDSALVGELAAMAERAFKDQSRELLVLASKRTELPNDVKADVASRLARRFSESEISQGLMDSGGNRAEHYDVPGIQAEIARAKLKKGYDVGAAATVVRDAKGALFVDEDSFQALKEAGAKAELKDLGDFFLKRGRGPYRQGEQRQREQRPEERGDWLAHASTCYLYAGLTDQAIAVAREGMAFVAPAVNARGNTDGKRSPREAIVAASGFGSNPVNALFRAGRYDEAVATGYLRGLDRYRLAEDMGIASDPAWVAEDSGWEVKLFTSGLMHEPDPEVARRLDDALIAVHEKKGDNTANNISAFVAALAGRTDRMRAGLAADAKDLDDVKSDDDVTAASSLAFSLAAQWHDANVIVKQFAPKSAP